MKRHSNMRPSAPPEWSVDSIAREFQLHRTSVYRALRHVPRDQGNYWSTSTVSLVLGEQIFRRYVERVVEEAVKVRTQEQQA